MNTQIKRIFAKILLYFLLFSFIFVTLYMNEVSLQQDKLYKCGNTENTYKIALTTELDDNDIFMTMQPVLDKYRANLMLLISEKTEYATIMTEYVYLSEPAFDDLILRSGRLLDASDNCSNVYVSSDDNSDENQIGIIDIFPCDTVFTIMPISDESMPENLFNRYIRLSLQNADDYTKITEDFAACGIYITEDTSEIPDSTVNFYIFFVPVFFIIVFVSLSLYEILNSYKSIAVKKLLGYSDFQIYLRYIAVSAVCMALSALLSLIICSLFSNINILSISCVKFIFNMVY